MHVVLVHLLGELYAGAVIGNLPAELTSFVGRRHELAEARRLLSSARLVTFVGVGGVGKTRLALRAAAEMRRAFGDGVWLVELEALSDPSLVPQAVAHALGLRDESFHASDRLADYLEDKSLLLVLDNCEHVADACCSLVGKLLAATSQVRVLATSRQRLGAEGEQLMPVEPFALLGDSAQATDSAAAGHEALTLFADRASAVVPGFDLSEYRASVIEICRRLDGLPLAIELAAVWLRALSVEELLSQLDNQFALLTTGRRTALPRQQRLEALIDWSFQLCSEAERLLWTRLAVFRGGFDLRAVGQVCAFGAIRQDEVLGIVAALVDKSVLIREKNTYGRGARYRMLNTIRDFAEMKLTADDLAEISSRHLDFCRLLAGEYRSVEFTGHQQEAAVRLRQDHANVRAAMEFGLASGRGDDALEMAADLVNFWIAAGLLADGYRWLDRVLAASPAPTRMRARALRGWIMIALWSGTQHGLRGRLAELGTLAERLGDPAIRFDALACRGFAGYFQGDLEAASRELESGLADRPDDVDSGTLAEALANLCLARFLLDAPDAESPGRDSLAVCEAHGRPQWPTAYSLWALGIAIWQRDPGRATQLQREAIRLREPVGDHSGNALSLEALAWCAAEGSPERAATLLGAAKMLWRLGGAGRIEPMLGRVSDLHAAAPAKEALGEAGFEKAFTAGSSFSVEQAIRYALADKKPARRRPAARTEPGALTRRETEIAGLVAEGLSNKEIAARLVISQRTAEAHVEHILAKLGFTSRAQIATWVANGERGQA